MIKITCSGKNLPEKKYLFDIIFVEFLGIGYELKVINSTLDYVIELPNNKQIVIQDHFWHKTNGEMDYLNLKYIPKDVVLAKSNFITEPDIPVLYGNGLFEVYADKIICGVDIFASTFFFLARWLEYVTVQRDTIDRFQLKNSQLLKHGLTNRPVVNEYVELLWKMLKFLEYEGERKERKFVPIITHDIDQPLRLNNFKMFLKVFTKDLIKFKDLSEAFKDLIIYPLNKINPRFDPANVYDFLMDVSEMIGARSTFNFQNSQKTKYDWGYDINSEFIQNIFRRIKDRGHNFGFHPSFYAFENSELWKKEYDGLCAALGENILTGRQHYLRFKIPFTWQIWEDNGMMIDESMGFAEREGFRCGTCYEYSVYNILNRKKLKLKERPLLLMEKSISGYQNHLDTEIFNKKFDSMVDVVKKYKGNFVFLWHNSSFDRKIYTKKFYQQLLQKLN